MPRQPHLPPAGSGRSSRSLLLLVAARSRCRARPGRRTDPETSQPKLNQLGETFGSRRIGERRAAV